MTRKVTYFLNSLSGGGAENGLLTLIDSGLFRGTDLNVLAINIGDGKIEAALKQRLSEDKLTVMFQSPNMSVWQLLGALIYYPYFLLKTKSVVAILSLEQTNLIGRFWGHLIPWVKIYSFEHNIKYSKKLYGPLLKLLSLPVKGILCDSKRTEEAVRQQWFINKDISSVVMPLFKAHTNNDAYKLRQPLSEPLRLACAGRLTAQKNQQIILQAVASLKSKGVKASVTLFGEGPDQEMLKSMAEKLAISDQVIFAGYDPKWSERVGNFDFYVQPSLYEGLCITLLEAMQTGIPCIASPVGEIIVYGKHNENMYLLEHVDGSELSEAIEKLAANRDLCIRLSKNAKMDMQRDYGENAMKSALNQSRNMMQLEG